MGSYFDSYSQPCLEPFESWHEDAGSKRWMIETVTMQDSKLEKISTKFILSQ
jgi:hypothetical protein